MLKYFFFVIVLLGFLSPFLSIAQGIDFNKDKNWAEILALAEKENKLIFVDVYTDWCGPCKVMDKEVFPLKKVGDVYNGNFINYKINAEKGEGINFAKKYNVQVYPNYLFLNPQGILVYRSTSALPVQKFIELKDIALEERKQPFNIEELSTEYYPSKKNDKKFMYDYILRRTKLGLDNRTKLDEYIALLTEKERAEIKNLQLILDNAVNENLILGISFKSLKANWYKYPLLKKGQNITLAGVEETAKETTLRLAIDNKDEKLLNEVLCLMPKFHDDILENKDTFLITYYSRTKQNKKHYDAVKNLMEKVLKYPTQALKKEDEKYYSSYMAKYREQANSKLAEFAKQRYSFTYIKNNYWVIANLLKLKLTAKQIENTEKWFLFTKDLLMIDNGKNYENLIPLFDYTSSIILYKKHKSKEAIIELEKLISRMNENSDFIKDFEKTLEKMKLNQEV